MIRSNIPALPFTAVMSVLHFLLCLVLLPSSRAAMTCDSMTLTLNSRLSPARPCLFEATKRGRPLVIAHLNGTCHVCGPSTLSPTHHQAARYSKLRRKHLMFRARAESGILVYETFMTGPLNQTTQTPEELAGSAAWYKSPLFDSPWLLAASEVHLELLRPNGSLAVKLTFSMSGARLQEEDAWFSKRHLLTAFPWDVTQMQAVNYDIFAMQGLESPLSHRRFYINIGHYGCPFDKGYLLVKGKVSQCEWENGTIYYPPYFWNPEAKNGNWKDNGQEAAEFRISVIIGLPTDQMTVYHRKWLQE